MVPIPTADDVESVDVPSILNPMPLHLYNILKQEIDPRTIQDHEKMFIITQLFVKTFAA